MIRRRATIEYVKIQKKIQERRTCGVSYMSHKSLLISRWYEMRPSSNRSLGINQIGEIDSEINMVSLLLYQPIVKLVTWSYLSTNLRRADNRRDPQEAGELIRSSSSTNLKCIRSKNKEGTSKQCNMYSDFNETTYPVLHPKLIARKQRPTHEPLGLGQQYCMPL